MTRLQTLISAALLLVAVTAMAADPALPELFKQAKDKFAAGDYKASLADFELLDKNSAKPGFENDRAKLIPVVTFYRGANLAALGRKNDAKDAFIAYLGYTPNATIASPPFPKATVELFDQARKEAATRSVSFSTAYAAFIAPPDWSILNDEHWIETPIRYLLTPAQKKEYATFTTNAERSAFIEAFWKQLDPTPTTEVNEFRAELERRVAYADATFATAKIAGRYTDRAVIFAFMGAPTYGAIANVTGDSIGDLRASNTNSEMRGAMRNTPTTGAGAVAHSLEEGSHRGVRETWVYRQGRIPKGIAIQELRFDFLTKEGYGSGVLQKDPQPMQALGQAVDIARAARQLN
jgi:hypothetical protein